jgi:Cu(I)/Ag(I) efflux system membrane fusion protein
MTTRNQNLLVATGLIAALGGIGLGFWWGTSRHADTAPTTAPAPASEKAVLYWYDPMVPDQHFDQPGKSPFMDMQLVPKYASEAAASTGVRIDPGVRQNLGLRTAVVDTGSFAASVRAPGTVGWNLREERIVSVPVEAVVERLFARTPFAAVTAGEPLVRLRAPAWSAALAEAQALAGGSTASARGLAPAARQRLRALGLPEGARTDGSGGVVLTAPQGGIVSEIAVREGESVAAGTTLLRINGTRTVWVEAAVPATAGTALAVGTPVQVTVDSRLGEVLTGVVEAWLPQLDPSTRSQRARIVLDNPDGALVAGQFVQVVLQSETARVTPWVPSSAVIADGTQTRVIVQDEAGAFRPVIVRTGNSNDGKTEILAGLSGGERVVVSGQFLIDSEANLSGALERLALPATDPKP